ncbi:hypothetical protein RM704_35865 [Streptomyces sp. DSM 3412]|uniref:MmyB-like transcription regulator ligand binding domain-containing protein n=1 Tax=Streptomyces gottesmaniae TaxID=3075518 RepID=A0ABU2Z867_9ACTN|nr:hypothetical protein [Streptomyces sp. DSM 3412]MDT0572780.1 hypothetical protein [Streptomyces sp. DSM 3412]
MCVRRCDLCGTNRHCGPARSHDSPRPRESRGAGNGRSRLAPSLVVLLAITRLGRVPYSPALTGGARPANLARFRFLDPAAADFYADLDNTAPSTVALLRTEVGRAPYNHDLTDLIGELSTHSDEFRTLWATHDVRLHRTGTKAFHHPTVGTLSLTYEAMPLPTDPGLPLTACTAAPGTASRAPGTPRQLGRIASPGGTSVRPIRPSPVAANASGMCRDISVLPSVHGPEMTQGQYHNAERQAAPPGRTRACDC